MTSSLFIFYMSNRTPKIHYFHLIIHIFWISFIVYYVHYTDIYAHIIIIWHLLNKVTRRFSIVQLNLFFGYYKDYNW